MFRLLFGMTEELLRSMHQLGDKKKVAFEARLRHLQRLGVTPALEKTGKGQRAEYGIGEFLSLSIAFELIELGVNPERAAGIVTSQQEEIRFAFDKLVQENNDETVVLAIDPRALQDGEPLVTSATLEEFTSLLSHKTPPLITRRLIINLTAIVRAIEIAVQPHRELLTLIEGDPIEAFRSAVRSWAGGEGA